MQPLTDIEEQTVKKAAVMQILDNQRERERAAVMEMSNRRIIDLATRDSELQRIQKRFHGAFVRERAVFEGLLSSWRDSPKLILHQLQQKPRGAAKRKHSSK
jgi:hypothetical protein